MAAAGAKFMWIRRLERDNDAFVGACAGPSAGASDADSNANDDTDGNLDDDDEVGDDNMGDD
jgi:hypothetical protein